MARGSVKKQIDIPSMDQLQTLYQAAVKRNDIAGANVAEAAIMKVASAEGRALEAGVLAKFLSTNP